MTDRAGEGGIGGKVKARIALLRARWPWFDHVMRVNDHYEVVRGKILAGAVTYFGFLSFFPLLALGFFVIGYVKQVYPDSEDALKTAIDQVLPGIISDKPEPPPGKISFQQIQDAKAAAGVIGLVGVLYSGLGWISGLREGLTGAFAVSTARKRNFFLGKAVDIAMLVTIGLVLVVSVAISSVIGGFAASILDLLGLPGVAGSVLLWVVALVIGVAASSLLFYTMYRLLPPVSLPGKALWQGAVFAAVGFELLKQIVVQVLGGVGGSAFAPLALSVTLVVWINYFSRLTMYGAAWAYTSPAAARAREASIVTPRLLSDGADTTVRVLAPAGQRGGSRAIAVVRPVAVFGGIALALRAWVKRDKRRHP
ncbi:MAG: YihY/virulence factor BrkB family protein [Streptosporangiaceae bacterium]